VAIGSYPFFRDGRTGANFVVRATGQDLIDRCVAALVDALRAARHDVIDGGI
jgi:hypothetical protein